MWELILAIVGFGWVFTFSVSQVLLSWQEARVGKKRKKVWRAALLCLFWAVWRERNKMTFENEAFFTYKLKSYFICNFWSWSNAHSRDRDRTLLAFLTWMG